MKRLLKYYFEEYRNVFDKLNDDYDRRIDLARDKRNIHFLIFYEVDDEYRKIQNDVPPYGWQIYNDVKKMVVANKHLTIDEAIIEYTKSDTEELRKEKIKRAARIRAYSKYFDVKIKISNYYTNQDKNRFLASFENEEIANDTISKSSTPTSQQVLAMHYFFEALKISNNRMDTAKAEFIKMLTGKNIDSIKDFLKNPLENKGLKGQNEDLEFVKKYFVKLKMTDIVNRINKDLVSTTSKIDN